MSEKLTTCYSCATRAGVFYIQLLRDARWHIVFDDESLGSYVSPQHALDDLCGGHTASCAAGDTSELGIPDEISSWIVTR